jgi:septal ring factor EnvC (AmiA/AmiB activator)
VKLDVDSKTQIEKLQADVASGEKAKAELKAQLEKSEQEKKEMKAQLDRMLKAEAGWL